MELGITGKKALVCAASKGLGRAIAEALANEGVDIFLCARDESALQDVAERIKADFEVKCHVKACDLTIDSERDQLVDAVRKEFSSIDILVHNVGGPKTSAAEETSVEDWRSGFNQLFVPIVDLNQRFLDGMKQKKWGRIVAVTSLSVMEPISGLTISNGMRSAVTALLKTLSDEIARHGITVNCVAPGLVATDRTEQLMEARVAKSGQPKDDYMKEYLKSIPAGRLGDPAEFGASVAFLCSQQAGYITGSTLCVDGGKRRSTY